MQADYARLRILRADTDSGFLLASRRYVRDNVRSARRGSGPDATGKERGFRGRGRPAVPLVKFEMELQ